MFDVAADAIISGSSLDSKQLHSFLCATTTAGRGPSGAGKTMLAKRLGFAPHFTTHAKNVQT